MSDIVIKVENLAKQYRLGLVGTGSLIHDLNRNWYRLRGKEDPYIKIGETNDRTTKSEGEYVWALKDINFEVKQGEVLGIIGRNGAGKSTLLKILSRTTSPTRGSVKIKGRVASLLEVGTGFHPELSGKENIYLNGAILGMTKQEIKGKFDEIVDFAGVQRYIDTPVKRYSSGMYVRLAFGVAAHLEPEILIVDEVLAVGDAEFQKKALGKMKDVSDKDGRTVLFVSHNMEAIQNLCSHGILINQGEILTDGLVSEVIKKYMNVFVNANPAVAYSLENAPGNDLIRLLTATVAHDNFEQYQYFTANDSIIFNFVFAINTISSMQLDVTYHLTDERGILVYVGSTFWNYEESFEAGRIKATCEFPSNILNEGNYTISRLLIVQNKGNIIADFKNVISFDMVAEKKGNYVGWIGKKQGVLRLPNVNWTLSQEHNGYRIDN